MLNWLKNVASVAKNPAMRARQDAEPLSIRPTPKRIFVREVLPHHIEQTEIQEEANAKYYGDHYPLQCHPTELDGR